MLFGKIRPMNPRSRLAFCVMSLVFGLGVFASAVNDGWFADREHLLFPIGLFAMIWGIVTFCMRLGFQDEPTLDNVKHDRDALRKFDEQ